MSSPAKRPVAANESDGAEGAGGRKAATSYALENKVRLAVRQPSCTNTCHATQSCGGNTAQPKAPFTGVPVAGATEGSQESMSNDTWMGRRP